MNECSCRELGVPGGADQESKVLLVLPPGRQNKGTTGSKMHFLCRALLWVLVSKGLTCPSSDELLASEQGGKGGTRRCILVLYLDHESVLYTRQVHTPGSVPGELE